MKIVSAMGLLSAPPRLNLILAMRKKSLIPVIPGIFRVPALTGSVTEIAKQMAFGFAMPIIEICRAIAFSCSPQSQILADDPFSSFLSSHTLGP